MQAIVNVVGMSKMQPSIKDLLPRLTPILKNRHEKVQENCIDLVGRIAGTNMQMCLKPITCPLFPSVHILPDSVMSSPPVIHISHMLPCYHRSRC
jgi:hypothetical protein